MTTPHYSYAKIVSALNVEDEAVCAFYTALVNDQAVEEYIQQHHLYFCSKQIEGFFLSHVLALTELILEMPSLSTYKGNG